MNSAWTKENAQWKTCFFSREVCTHTHNRKIPKPKNREVVFCIRGVLFTESTVWQREKDYRREKDSGNSFLWGGQLDPLLQNNKGQVFGPKIILPYLQQGNSSGNNFQRFLYSLIVSLQQSKEFKDKLKGICSSASCCTTSTVPGMAPLPNSRLSWHEGGLSSRWFGWSCLF